MKQMLSPKEAAQMMKLSEKEFVQLAHRHQIMPNYSFEQIILLKDAQFHEWSVESEIQQDAEIEAAKLKRPARVVIEEKDIPAGVKKEEMWIWERKTLPPSQVRVTCYKRGKQFISVSEYNMLTEKDKARFKATNTTLKMFNKNRMWLEFWNENKGRFETVKGESQYD